MKDGKLETAKSFLVASGGVSIGRTIVSGIIDALRPSADVPEEWWDEIQRDFSCEELIARLAALYAQEIPVDDLESLTACYESPAGRRYVAQLPALTQESMRIGQEWGAVAAKRIAKELERRLDSAIEEMEEKVAAQRAGRTTPAP